MPFKNENGNRKVKDRIGCFEDNSCPVQNPSQPVSAQWEGDDSQLDTGIKTFIHETGNYFERIQSLITVKDTAEGFTNSAGVCRHLLHCQTEPQFKKSSFPRKNVEVEQGPGIPSFCAAQKNSVCLSSFDRLTRM